MKITLLIYVKAETYCQDGEFIPATLYYGCSFDGVHCSESGKYKVIYQKFGTKAVVFADGKELYELNRPYYKSQIYEFPLALIELDNTCYIAHGPDSIFEVVIEKVTTREVVVKSPESGSFFHSRLQFSNDGDYLLSAGWYWHPESSIKVFKFKGFENESGSLPEVDLQFNYERASAKFIDSRNLLIGFTTELSIFEYENEEYCSVNGNDIIIYDIVSYQITRKCGNSFDVGDLVYLSHHRVWSLFENPKIINLNTGNIEYACQEIYSGSQNGAVESPNDATCTYALAKDTGHLAIGYGNTVYRFSSWME